MASPPSNSAYEGVLAIHKPLGISSAQVIRDAQQHFNPSTLFKPWFDKEKSRRENESHNQRQKRRSWKQRQPLQLKMGHGGTLDPQATGVLILGIGSGTKSLSKFIECTKTYDAVILFGAATDSYDAAGKIVAKKSYDHVKKEMVEEALSKFRGKIMQRPPIFSALKVQGKPLYEYAREGKEVPIKIEERPVEVESLEMTEWMDGGTHQYQWPDEEAPEEEKVVVDKVLHLDADIDKKRKRDESGVNSDGQSVGPPPSPKRRRNSSLPAPTATNNQNDEPNASAQPTTDKSPCPAPACRLRMTVTSGFYVRSLAHGLGEAVNSLALMSSLVRTRQGDFELGQNVLEYDDLAKGEDHWSPEVSSMLADWKEKEGIESSDDEMNRVVRGPREAKPKLRSRVREGQKRKREKEEEKEVKEEGRR